MPKSKWCCPECGSLDVQVSLPSWFRETDTGDLEYVEVDGEADIRAWYCDDCGESCEGEPDRSPVSS